MFESASDDGDDGVVPGPDAVAAGSSDDLGVSGAGPRSILARLATVEQRIAADGAERERLLAEADAYQGSVDDPKEWFSEEVAAVLRVDGGTARTRMMYAADLVDRLPSTFALLAAGEISALHARVLCEAVHALPDADASRVEELVLARAGAQTVGQFRRSLKRAVNIVAPALVEQACADAVAGRRVWVRPDEDAMTQIGAVLPCEQALRVQTALNHLADTQHYEDLLAVHDGGEDRQLRTADQYRADALVALAEHYLADPRSYLTAEQRERRPVGKRVGKRVKVRPQILVTVALSTLLGQDDNPGELAGYGPIPASLARKFAGDKHATWRRLLTDPQGKLIDYGRTKYKPPSNLDHFVRTKYQTCAFPTCSGQALNSEIDHVKPWIDGGPTNAQNLLPLCARHHHLKHEAGWTINHDPNRGITQWTTPRGHTYTNTADPLPLSTFHNADVSSIADSPPGDGSACQRESTDADLDNYDRASGNTDTADTEYNDRLTDDEWAAMFDHDARPNPASPRLRTDCNITSS